MNYLIIFALLGCYICIFARDTKWWRIFQKWVIAFFGGRKNEEAGEETNVPSVEEAMKLIKGAFKRMNITPQYEENDENHIYQFEYQSGAFYLELDKNAPSTVRLLFPGIFHTDLDYVDAMRILCNEINVRSNMEHAIYVASPEENAIILHLTAGFPLPESEEALANTFKSSAAHFFAINRFAHQRIEEIMQLAKTYETTDTEYAQGRKEAIVHLIEESQVKFSEETFSLGHFPGEEKEQLTIGHFLARTLLLHGAELCEMEVSGEGLCLQYEADADIRNYALPFALLAKDGTQADGLKAFARQNAEIRIKATRSIHTAPEEGKRDTTLYLMLRAGQTTENTLYFRLTYCIAPYEIGTGKQGSALKAQANPATGSMLLGYDLKSPNQKQAEFDYLWKEAKEHAESGNLSELSEEQRVVANVMRESEAVELFWGNRLLRERRFMEASIRLERLWDSLNGRLTELTRKDKTTYYNTANLLGVCLYRMELYRQAYYYLQLSEDEGIIVHTKMLINCLLRTNDPRAMKIVRQSMMKCEATFHEIQQNDEEPPASLTDFYDYLKRCEVHLLINWRNLYKAEALCKIMLDMPNHADFAMNGLARIQRLRDSGVKNNDSGLFGEDIPDS